VATTQEAVQISAIVPTLTVDDLQKSITFYEALGFAIDERWEEKGTLLGVMLRAGKSQIGLNQDDWKKGRDRKKGIGVRLSISAPGSVDEIAKRAKNAGITLKSEPRDTEWKSRAFEVSDPSGFLLNRLFGNIVVGRRRGQRRRRCAVFRRPSDRSRESARVYLRDIADVKRLKQEDLVHALLANDLVDAMSSFTVPVVLGGGKKLFADGSAPQAHKLTRSRARAS
jgi:uncharacterized glyoxalase superfamily protein PhnB